MKKLFLSLFFVCSAYVFGQFTMPAESPRQRVEQQFSVSKIVLDYGRPGVKGRKIFGELVPYGKVWRAGANSSTKITFGQSVSFNGNIVPAGTYGLFIVPSEKEWKIILNKDSDQWGAYEFDAKLNVLETSVPIQKSVEKQEYFEISFEPISDSQINMIFKWDTVKAELAVKTANPEIILKITEKLKEIKQIERETAKK